MNILFLIKLKLAKLLFFDRIWMKETEFPGFKAIGNFLIKILPTA